MTRHVVCAALIFTSTVASAQERQPAKSERREVEFEKAQLTGKLRAAVEMRITRAAPYSGEATTEFVQSLPDGNRIARKTVVRIHRDSEGRVRREHLTTDGASIESVTIVDPVSRNTVILEPDTRTAYGAWRRISFNAGSGWTDTFGPLREAEHRKVAEIEARKQTESMPPPPPPPPPPQPMTPRPRLSRSDGGEQLTHQDLGQRVIEGVNARGTRTTTVIPAGAIGNDQPIRIVSEEWFSPDLQVLVLTKHSDPRSGETTYTLSNIVRAEPDRSLFDVPADYTRK